MGELTHNLLKIYDNITIISHIEQIKEVCDIKVKIEQ